MSRGKRGVLQVLSEEVSLEEAPEGGQDWAVLTSVGRSFHHCRARVEKERALEAGERRGGTASLLVQEERRG